MRLAFRSALTAALLVTTPVVATSPALAHCQIPCGIYDDKRVFDELEEHVDTIKRSIEGLKDSTSSHDTVRWVINKESHAQKIQDQIAEYFFAQRIKAAAKDSANFESYQTSLELAHKIIVAAMKAKQSDEMKKAEALEAAVKAYRKHYFDLHGHEH
jgi:nickel superoxide dismutase